MADTVLNTTVFDGAKKLITHYNVVSDGTGSTTKIVDVSGLNSNNGKTCKTVRLNKVSFNVSVTAPVDAIRMQWDADTDVVFQTLAGEMEYDYSNIMNERKIINEFESRYDNYIDINNSPGKLSFNTKGIFTNKLIPFVLNYNHESHEDITKFLEDSKQFDHILTREKEKEVKKIEDEMDL